MKHTQKNDETFFISGNELQTLVIVKNVQMNLCLKLKVQMSSADLCYSGLP